MIEKNGGVEELHAILASGTRVLEVALCFVLCFFSFFLDPPRNSVF